MSTDLTLEISRMRAISLISWGTWLIVSNAGPVPLRADDFVFQDRDGTAVEVEARLVAAGQGVMVLETSDGQYRIIPEGSVAKRMVKAGPDPIDATALCSQLEGRFGAELFRSYLKDPFVIGLVLASPLPKASESRAKNFLTRAGTYMKGVEGAFVSFVKEARVTTKPPTHPLVVLIFESQQDFNKYADSITGGRGISANRIAGFYSGMTNFLAIRMAECRTFDVPLHEAIHQQVYNRHIFERLAPIPHWFDEGIATGFESTQGRISIGPTKISPRYARQVLAAKQVTFREIVTDDRSFAGDVLAGEAYGNAWALHWLLVTKYRIPYGKYVRLLSAKQPLAEEDSAQRLTDFQQAFGKSLAEIEKEFGPFLDNAIRKQKVDLNPERPPGTIFSQQDLGEVELTAVSTTGGRTEAQGKLTNISPLRGMAYHVTIETDGGTYAEWHIPNLDINKTIDLDRQAVTKLMRNVIRRGAAATFRVRIRSSAPDSEEAGQWKAGSLPVPEFSG